MGKRAAGAGENSVLSLEDSVSGVGAAASSSSNTNNTTAPEHPPPPPPTTTNTLLDLVALVVAKNRDAGMPSPGLAARGSTLSASSSMFTHPSLLAGLSSSSSSNSTLASSILARLLRPATSSSSCSTRNSGKILAVGCGNLSYELALTLSLEASLPVEGRGLLDCSVYEESANVFEKKFEAECGRANAAGLRTLKQRVLYGVDATRLPETLKKAGASSCSLGMGLQNGGAFPLPPDDLPAYSVIFWNNPYPVDFEDTRDPDNYLIPRYNRPKKFWRETLPVFLESAERVLEPNGVVCVTMTHDQAVRQTNLAGILPSGFRLTGEVLAFRSSEVGLYSPSYGDNRSEKKMNYRNGKPASFVSDANTRTYVFCRTGDTSPLKTSASWSSEDEGGGEPKAKRRKLEQQQDDPPQQAPPSSSSNSHSHSVASRASDDSVGREPRMEEWLLDELIFPNRSVDPKELSFERGLKLLIEMAVRNGASETKMQETRQAMERFCGMVVSNSTGTDHNINTVARPSLTPVCSGSRRTDRAAPAARTSGDSSPMGVARGVAKCIWENAWSMWGYHRPAVSWAAAGVLLDAQFCLPKERYEANGSDAQAGEQTAGVNDGQAQELAEVYGIGAWLCPRLGVEFVVSKKERLYYPELWGGESYWGVFVGPAHAARTASPSGTPKCQESSWTRGAWFVLGDRGGNALQLMFMPAAQPSTWSWSYN